MFAHEQVGAQKETNGKGIEPAGKEAQQGKRHAREADHPSAPIRAFIHGFDVLSCPYFIVFHGHMKSTLFSMLIPLALDALFSLVRL